ncbi:MAG: ATP-binding protein [Microcoleaceae cyanobacterium]
MTKYYDSLTVPVTLDSLSVIANYIKQIGIWANLSKKKVAKLRLAVDEIATNIIEYGYNNSSDNVIDFYAKLDNTQLILWIEDTGIPFNPNQQEIPEDLDKPLEEREIGGLGVYLAKINVDRLIYERVNIKNSSLPEINRNTLIVNLE